MPRPGDLCWASHDLVKFEQSDGCQVNVRTIWRGTISTQTCCAIVTTSSAAIMGRKQLSLKPSCKPSSSPGLRPSRTESRADPKWWGAGFEAKSKVDSAGHIDWSLQFIVKVFFSLSCWVYVRYQLQLELLGWPQYLNMYILVAPRWCSKTWLLTIFYYVSDGFRSTISFKDYAWTVDHSKRQTENSKVCLVTTESASACANATVSVQDVAKTGASSCMQWEQSVSVGFSEQMFKRLGL